MKLDVLSPWPIDGATLSAMLAFALFVGSIAAIGFLPAVRESLAWLLSRHYAKRRAVHHVRLFGWRLMAYRSRGTGDAFAASFAATASARKGKRQHIASH